MLVIVNSLMLGHSFITIVAEQYNNILSSRCGSQFFSPAEVVSATGSLKAGTATSGVNGKGFNWHVFHLGIPA